MLFKFYNFFVYILPVKNISFYNYSKRQICYEYTSPCVWVTRA